MADPGHVETEKILKQLENRIRKEYKQATEEMQEKIDEYWSKYKLKDQKWQEWVRDGKKTAKEYQMWEQQQLMVGKSWESLKTSLAEDMVHADDVAKAMTKATMPDVYAENFNYGTFSVEKAAKVDTSFTLYDQSTVTRILKDDPDLLPAPGKKVSKQIAEGKAMRWNKQQIQSVMTQGILQGESIPKLSKRLATTVGERNYKSAIRNARTMTTGAQNAGRMDSYKRAESKGIDLEVEWIATLDNRTRHEHRMLDGQTRPVGEPFEVHGIKIDYAGDPHAPARMIYNCRCTLAGHVKGFNAAEVERDTSGIGGMSYDDWKKEKRSQSNPIDLPEQKGKAIAEKYKKEYNGIKAYDRARDVESIDDLEKYTSSVVMELDSYEKIINYFNESYGITISGFDNKDIFSLQATFSGYDDMLKEFPEIMHTLKRIEYNPRIKSYGKYIENYTSLVGYSGLKSYGTGVHEATHALEFYRSKGKEKRYAETLLDKARKELGFTKRSKEFKSLATRVCSDPDIATYDIELIAYCMEHEKGNVSNKLTRKVYELIKENNL